MLLAVLCHGAAADARQMQPMRAAWGAAGAMRFLVPTAPARPARTILHRIAQPRRARREWFSLADRRFEAMAQVIGPASDALNAMIDAELARLRLSDEALLLGGFSQGGMLALHAGLRRPVAPRAIAVIAGAVIAPGDLTAQPRNSAPVLMVHGAQDRVVPASAAAASLRESGISAEAVVIPHAGHALCQEMIDLTTAFIAAHALQKGRTNVPV